MIRLFTLWLCLLSFRCFAAYESFVFVDTTDIHIDRPGTFNPGEPTNNFTHIDSTYHPAFILTTGDIADNSCGSSYVQWDNITNLLTAPVWTLTGNHDACPEFCGTTNDAGVMPCSESYSNYFALVSSTNHWTHDYGSFRFIGFASHEIRSGGLEGFGYVTDSEVAWTSNQTATAKAAGKNIIFATHFPIYDTLGNNIKSNQLAIINVITNVGTGSVVACFFGHRHSGFKWETNSGVLHVLCPSLAYNGGQVAGGYLTITATNSTLQFRQIFADDPTYTDSGTNTTFPYNAPLLSIGTTLNVSGSANVGTLRSAQ